MTSINTFGKGQYPSRLICCIGRVSFGEKTHISRGFLPEKKNQKPEKKGRDYWQLRRSAERSVRRHRKKEIVTRGWSKTLKPARSTETLSSSKEKR